MSTEIKRAPVSVPTGLPFHPHVRQAIRDLNRGHLSLEEFVKKVTPKTRDLTTREMVKVLAEERYSWARIARALGITRQSVGEHVQALLSAGELDAELVRK